MTDRHSASIYQDLGDSSFGWIARCRCGWSSALPTKARIARSQAERHEVASNYADAQWGSPS